MKSTTPSILALLTGAASAGTLSPRFTAAQRIAAYHDYTQCSWHFYADGPYGPAGPVTQISDGQIQIHEHGSDKGAEFKFKGGKMYGPPEFGCLVAEPQKQIQCDHGKDGHDGFAIEDGKLLTLWGNPKIWACPIDEQGKWNIYTEVKPPHTTLETCKPVYLHGKSDCQKKYPPPPPPPPPPSPPKPEPDCGDDGNHHAPPPCKPQPKPSPSPSTSPCPSPSPSPCPSSSAAPLPSAKPDCPEPSKKPEHKHEHHDGDTDCDSDDDGWNTEADEAY